MPSFHQDCSCKDRKEHDMMQKELELENKELISYNTKFSDKKVCYQCKKKFKIKELISYKNNFYGHSYICNFHRLFYWFVPVPIQVIAASEKISIFYLCKSCNTDNKRDFKQIEKMKPMNDGSRIRYYGTWDWEERIQENADRVRENILRRYQHHY